MTHTIMEFHHVEQRFGDNVVLKDINFAIEAGKFYTLLGPSGSGKTTILRLIAGFDRPTSGEIDFAGQKINDVPANRRQVNTVFQDYALFPHLNVAENIAFGLQIKGVTKMKLPPVFGKLFTLFDLTAMTSDPLLPCPVVSVNELPLPGQLLIAHNYSCLTRHCRRLTISYG